jgi:16S rRNA (cytosine1402-N4)-methyltransferase
MHQNKNQNQHIPVLLQAVIDYLAPKSGEHYLDLTAGYGGHAAQILGKTRGQAILVDRDQNAIDYLREHYQTKSVIVWHQDFLTSSRQLNERGERFDLILADLGVSSPHLNMANRGFSFQHDGPLDMRMDQRQTLTADDIVNGYVQHELTTIIRQYGEEPQAAKIAQSIVANRPIHTTTKLATVIAGAFRRGRPKVHPATRTFQALRLKVNDELEQLYRALPIWIDLLRPDGRLVVISFHSLEDRFVKQTFIGESQGYEARLKLLTKKPVVASRQELVFNPRARSAKLRAVVKINSRSPPAKNAR